jgi:dinuclear metal center YbgI/SA1388 family protein
MTCRVADVTQWMEETFPPGDAEAWDMVGLLVGDLDAEVDCALVALDPTSEVLRVAASKGASLLITHHPIWIRPVERICRQEAIGGLVWEAIRGGVSVYCAHTNLDRSPGGPNDILADLLELRNVEPIEEGLGRVGELADALDLDRFCARMVALFPRSEPRAAGRVTGPIRKVAVCCGSGASMLEAAMKVGSQILVTGDIKYHDARNAEHMGMALLDIGHFDSERSLVPWLASLVSEQSAQRGWGIQVIAYDEQRDPLRMVLAGHRGGRERSGGEPWMSR